MKHFIKNSFICFFMLFIIDKSAYFILKQTPNHLYDTRLKKVLEGKMNKDLIILGSSKGAGNIIASQIEAETGLESYNLSYMGSDVTFHNFVLKTLLKYNKAPKKILLTIDNPAEFIPENSLNFRLDQLYPLVLNNSINNTLINQNDRSSLSKYFLLARLSKAHFNYNDQKPSKDNPLLQDGSMPFVNHNTKANKEFIYKDDTYSKLNELETKLYAFKGLQQLCEKHNIQLHYIFSPKLTNFNEAFYVRFLNLVNNKNNIFKYNSNNPIYKKKSTFYDQSHLMLNGAKVFTSEISAYLKSY